MTLLLPPAEIEFIAPGYLVLAVLVPLLWFLPRRLGDLPLGLLRSAVLLLVVIAAARPVAYEEDPGRWHVYVLDTSDSVAPQTSAAARAVVRRARAALPARDRSRVIAVEGERASLGRALAAADRAIPLDARGSVTLLSDGRSTERDWGRATAALTARGVPVHVVALEGRVRDAALVGLSLPRLLRTGATARVLVRLVGTGVSVRVRLSGPNGELAHSDVLDLDGPAQARLSFEPEAPGYLPLTARLEVVEGSDGDPGDDALQTVAAVQDPLRVLYLGARMVEGGPQLEQLVGRGFSFRSLAEGETPTKADVAAADLVVLDDRPADTIPLPVHAAIVDAVRDGRTGLLMSGGRAAFGAGGYQRSPLAAVLPVEMVQKEEKRDPSTTLAVVIDTSGSMGGNRVQLAKEVARLAIRRLLPHDKVGIVEFYGAKRWAAPIQPASNAIEIQRALNRLNAGGGTVIMPAIEEAFYGLMNVRTRYKHVLVLTDGGVEQGAFEPLVRRMAAKGITVSTVLIGPDAHSEFLVSIANWGKGRFYSVPNRFNLPEILLKQPAGAQLPSWRPGTYAVDPHGGPVWWGPIAGAPKGEAAIPPLNGYVEARTKPGAQLLLEVRATKHPVLATWRHGAGRATAFLSEPAGPGTADWRNWPGYGTWMARVLARTASDTRAPYAFTLARRGRRLALTARRLLADAPPPEARLDGRAKRPLPFQERAPGTFQARFSSAPAEEVRILAGARGDAHTRLVSPAFAGRSPERQVDDRERLDLEALAAASGGAALPLARREAFLPPAGGGARPVAVRALWPYLLGAALLFFLLELAYRRRPRRSSTREVA